MSPVVTFIFHYLRKTKLLVALTIFCILVHTLLDRGSLYFLSRIIGLMPEYAENAAVLNKIILFFALFTVFRLSDTAFDYMWHYVNAKFMPYFNSLISRDLFQKVHHHSITFFNEEMVGKIAAKVKNITNGIKTIFRQVYFGILFPFFSLSVSLFLIFSADIKLGFILLSLNFMLAAIVLRIRFKIGSYAEKRSHFAAESEGIFADTVTNSDLVKSFANYFYEKRRFYSSLKKAVLAEQTELIKDAWFDWGGKTLFDLMRLSSLGIVFYFWYIKAIMLSDFVLCSSLINGLVREVANLSYFAGEFSRQFGQVKDGLALINQPCRVVDCADAHNMKMRGRSVKIENISYHYGNKDNLFTDFNLNIKSGEKIGLVGHSGSGKSTLIKLLARYYDLDSGRILIGGEDISQVRQESLRAQIAIIPQDTTLFNRTIMENIRYGNVNATDEEVIVAARMAYADEFIRELPQGYQSKVGERGVMLSGGERQRIAIARAILKNAPILILDEATSALDSLSEQYIQKSLKKLMKGKTVIAIAHRLSTLKEMDRLIVIDKGKIVEEGTHEDLLSRRRAYYDFYQIQTLNK